MVSHSKSSPADVRRFRKLLLRWFQKEQRKLPWRGERDPYRVLVSEIMLQQTRVAVVEDRYHKFIQQFPTIQRLARAKEQTVLAAWSGLGYYRRARALHAAAKTVAGSGKFPQVSSKLEELPGVGRYTAAAVASIAFGEPVAVVDGNVKRVLERLSGRQLRGHQCWQMAGELLDPQGPGDFNQAMMELGALVCLPGQPLCGECPVVQLCAERGAGAKRKPGSRTKAVLQYSLVRKNGSVLLRQRAHDSSLMPGMWELPQLTSSNVEAPLLTLRHSITTTDYTVMVFAGNERAVADGKWVRLRNVDRLALTGLARKIFQRFEIP